MNVIKFSHVYPKLWGQTEAELIAVRGLGKSYVTKELIEYDTKTIEGTYYKLPETKLLQLIFLGDKEIPFCTLRRWSIEKEEYYRSKIGQRFLIEITPQENLQ